MSLETRVCGITFKTPLILASGWLTETPRFFLKASQRGCAAMVTRSLKKNPRPEVTAPRYFVPRGGDWMLNTEWGNEYPWNLWKEQWVHEINESGHPLIISLSGRNIEECCELIEEFDGFPVSAFEENISCAHSGFLHGNLNTNFDHVRNILNATRPLTTKPIWIKLSFSPFLTEMAKIAQDHGADAIVYTNSIGPGFAIDTLSTKPALGIHGGRGGFTGRSLFPIALEGVWSLSQELSIPVIGAGGIWNTDTVLQMLMAGASAVQIYTEAALKGLKIFRPMTAGLQRYMDANGYGNIADIIGISHTWAFQSHQFAANPPSLIKNKCTGCGLCYPACNFDAIRFEANNALRRSVAVIQQNCTACNACVGVCPEQCIIPHFERGDKP